MKRLRILTLFLSVAAFALHSYKQSIETPSTLSFDAAIPDDWYETTGTILTPKEDRRMADQTYLTFPEWFLVFSPEEQANFFKSNTATNYPYQSQVHQFWDSYGILKSRIGNNYPYNDEYNTMINVIGVSTEIEYDMKSWYETVIGRATQTSTLTDEDIFTQKYTADYASSLNTAAWYDFDYKTQLKKLWSETSFFGANMHRKLERKYVLTSEFLVKIAYAELIKFGSNSMYGEVPTTTVIVTDRITEKIKRDETVEVLSSQNGAHVLRIPRYTAFTETAGRIANEGVNISEVAGNKSAILISLIVDNETKFDKEKTRVLFTQTISTDPHLSRKVLVTPIRNLAAFIRDCQSRNLLIEHIYDF